jgi:hypothetical protein
MRPVPAVLIVCLLFPLALVVVGQASGAQPRPTPQARTANDTTDTANAANSTKRVYCEVIPDAPERDNADRPTKVIGKVRFRCDEPGATAIRITLKLQKQGSGDTWADVASTSFTAAGADTVGTRDETFRTREVSAACSTGTFRTQITGTSQSRGSSKTYDRPGPRAFDPCRPGIFAEKG